MTEWKLKATDDFTEDTGKLDKKILEILNKKIGKIKENPERPKHLYGKGNYYREAITKNFRLIYILHEKTIWLVTFGTHKEVYKKIFELREFNSDSV